MSALPPEPPAVAWRIELLGQIRACRDGQVLTRFGGRKITALLAHLALNPRRSVSREELIDLLWPDADLATGRNRLRQALFSLRKLLEPQGSPPVLQADDDRVGLRPGALSSDVDDFEALVRKGNWLGARALYGGDLLPGHYEDWVVEQRLRLANLAEQAEQQKDPQEGLQAPPLPVYLTPFFGREDELAALAQALQAHRLVTLTGPGGTGKTRLATELAHREQARFELVAFVALADCRRADELPTRLRSALQLTAAPGDALDTVQQCLRGRRALLVMDNYEQLVAEGGAAPLASLLQALPDLHLLVSSRRRLGPPGERCIEVQPLPLPKPDDDLSACAANPAVALFVDRAQAARSSVRLQAQNKADVLALCAALEGVPLALELAASRAHVLSLGDMRQQLQTQLGRAKAASQRSDVLNGPAHHASLDAAIDWSWQLLDARQQQALAALSVFRGGFTANDAAALLDEPDSQSTLALLVADSLLRAEPEAQGPMRHHLYEMVREFAAARLHASRAAMLRQRLRQWMLRRAHEQPVLPEADEPNLNEALVSAMADGQPDQAIELSLAAADLWARRGASPEVRRVWLAALAALPPQALSTEDLHAARCLFAARLHEADDPVSAHALADQAVEAAGADRRRRAQALAVQLRLRWKDRPRADDGLSAALREALALTDGGDDLQTRADLLNLLGEVMVQGARDPEAALTFYDEALSLYERAGQERLAWDVRLGQGICAQAQGRFDDALALHAAVAKAAERLGDTLLLIDACSNLAVASTLARRWHEAVQHGCRALLMARSRHSHYMQLMALWNLARPLVRSGRAEAALQVLGFCVREWQTHYAALAEADWRYVRLVRGLAGRTLGPVRSSLAWAEGESLTLADAVSLAIR